MSASPAGPSPSGRPGTTPNGTAPVVHRPRPKPNPLVASRKPARKPVVAPRPPTSAHGAGALNQRNAPGRTPGTSPHPAPSLTTVPPVAEPSEPAIDYPLYTTRRALLEGVRHHILRFGNKNHVNIMDQEQFVRPVLLHRRDPRAPPVGADQNSMDVDSKEELAAAEEREKQEALREERRRIREENMAQVAPTGKAHRPPAFQKKTEQVFRTDDTPEAAKASQLRYEEAVPWHLEDFTGNNVYQGTYEAAMSECYVAFRPVAANDFCDKPHIFVYPIEKFYRFREKNKFKAYTLEEAEEKMGKKFKESRWEMNQREAQKMKAERLKVEGGLGQSAMSLRRGERGELTKTNVAPKKQYIKREGVTAGDEDDIDFNIEEEFADDEENPLFEGENEEVKDAENRIRKDQLGANAFELLDSKAVEEEAEREKKARELKKALEKSTKKALMKRERRNDYESDSDSNPYESKSESEDSETERRKEEERKREEEAKAAEKGKSREDKLPSEVSTPSGRASKHAAPPMQKSASSNSLKRPNSPNASDLSGNESSRKKQKQSHLVSRMSPGPPDSRGRQPSLVGRRLQGAGSGSDTDASANTRRLKKQQQRIALSPNGTPGASRAGSPDATGARESRAGSPAAQQAKKPATTGPMPTTDEILPLLPPEGIAIPALLALFRGRVPKERSKEFFATVKQVAVMHKDTKLVFPKGGKRAGKDSAASPEPASTAAGS